MLLFDPQIQWASDHVRMGTSVLLKGRRGSGRTGALKRIVADLERIGLHVLYATGHSATTNQPYAALISQGFAFSKQSVERAPLQVADFVAQQMTNFESTVVVFDDVDLIDPESLAVFDLVLRRTKNPWLIARSSRFQDDERVAGLLDRWPVASLTLPSLRHAEVAMILRERLGGATDPALATLVMTESGGIPALVAAICDSLVFSSRLTRRDGKYGMAPSASGIWNEHLEPVVESWLHSLSGEQRQALEVLALVGIRPMATVREVVDAEVLRELDRAGLLSFLGGSNSLHVALDPPLIAEYFRHSGRRSPLVSMHLRERLDDSRWPPEPLTRALPGATVRTSARALLSAETDREDSVLSKYFLDQLMLGATVRFERWRGTPDAETALEYLDVALGQQSEQARVSDVFSGTTMPKAGLGWAEAHLIVRQAQWLAFQREDLDGALRLLEDATAEHPDWRAEFVATAMLVRAPLRGIAPDFETALAAESTRHPECGVVATVTAFLLVCSGRADDALGVIADMPEIDESGRLISFVRGLALFFSGQHEAALAFALEGRAQARRNLDSHGLSAHTYVAMLCMLYSGLWDEAERMAGNLHTLTPPGGFMSLVYDATYRLSALVIVVEGRRDANVAPVVPPGPRFGPLLGFGKAVLGITRGDDGYGIDPIPELVEVIRDQARAGFVEGATYAAILGLCLFADPALYAALDEVLTPEDRHRHTQLLRLGEAVVGGDAAELDRMIDEYERDVNTFMCGLMLKVAAARSRTAAERDKWADAFIRFHGRFPEFVEPPTDSDLSRLRVNLTERERDVALLGGSLTNQQIATRLGISVRTVENHIANAMRKVGSDSRSALFRVVYQNHTILGDREEVGQGGRRVS